MTLQTRGREGKATVELRRATPADAGELYRLVVQVTIDAPRTQAIGPDEVRDEAKQRARIVDSLKEDNALMLLAFDDGVMVGELTAMPGTRKRLAHNLNIGMSIAKSHRGRGVGRAMLTQALAWAQTRPTLRVARLACVASNTPARALYESCGFVVNGVQPGYFVFEDGSSEDDVVMSRGLG